MPVTKSPLRYPGGKTQLSKFVKNILEINNINNGTYIEPFAGGAGVAIELLLSNSVDRIVINDYDKSIYSIWNAILNHTKKFVNLIETTPITIEEWHKQKSIYLKNRNSMNSLEGGFATFYLNRTNVSGIINGGPIGGKKQLGKYKIDCRFNKSSLIEKVMEIADRKENIDIFRKDANQLVEIIKERYSADNSFIFFDPPYFVQGQNLYLSFISEKDHEKIGKNILSLDDYYWITTYDKAPQITDIYNSTNKKFEYSLNYSANQKKIATEVIFASSKTRIESFEKVILQSF
ncbi:DNA methyltransferase [Carnobacterium divergens]|uniref:DNA adenine methylase n=1 Tax=Carnobacterium divergens TaxID=2748 RepID=UPI0010748F60|nr:DNA adenine methylase [Carnobacterium divergens]TFI87412.1 DNA methyltransferase [Carnobacterium divergens]